MKKTNIIRSTINPDAVLYQESRIIDSKVGAKCIVGDFSRVYKSELMEYVKIDRNNFILSSTLGRYTYTGNFTVIQEVEIGSFCSVSWGVSIGGGEHQLDRFTTHDILYNNRYGFAVSDDIASDRYQHKCQLENDVWIGANSVITRGVHIGNGAVVGAGSVVTKDVPDYAIVAGNPAKVIRYRFSEDVIERLLTSKWWTLERDILMKQVVPLRNVEIEKFLDVVELL
jgi:virginiamycin A acetyltransferase